MSKRLTDTDKWGDPWFSELNASRKLLWLYLLDTCDHAGVYKHSIRLMEFHTGERLTIQEVETVFKDRVFAVSDEVMFIPKFLKFQYASGLTSRKPVIVSVVKRLKDLDLIPMVQEQLGNDFITITEPLNNDCNIIKDKSKDKSKDKDKRKSKDKKEKLEHTLEFEKLWNSGVLKVGKVSRNRKPQAKEKYLKARSKLTEPEIVSGWRAYIASFEDSDDAGGFCYHGTLENLSEWKLGGLNEVLDSGFNGENGILSEKDRDLRHEKALERYQNKQEKRGVI